MKGLLLKDLLSLRKYMRTMALFVMAYALLTFFMDSSDFLNGMIVLLCAMIPITSFSLDHQSGWDIYELSLPVSRKDIVRSKYLLALILTLIGTGISIAIGLAYRLFTHSGDMLEALTVSYALFAVGLIFASVLLPLIFKFGVEKSRLLLIAVFAIPTAAFVALSSAGVKLPGEQTISRLFAFSPLILVAALALSYASSCAIYRKKEI